MRVSWRCSARSNNVQKYLSSQYLTECAQDIRYFFDNKRRDKVKELQTIHADLSDSSSFLKLQKTILRLTEDYWNQLRD